MNYAMTVYFILMCTVLFIAVVLCAIEYSLVKLVIDSCNEDKTETIRFDIEKRIKYWRNENKNAKNDDERLMATCYIDAYQSVMINHGLGVLK